MSNKGNLRISKSCILVLHHAVQGTEDCVQKHVLAVKIEGAPVLGIQGWFSHVGISGYEEAIQAQVREDFIGKGGVKDEKDLSIAKRVLKADLFNGCVVVEEKVHF